MNKERFTINMMVESMHELELDWTAAITVENVSAAYRWFVDRYNQMLADGVEPTFDIDVKEQAKDHLMKLAHSKQ